MAGGAGPIIIVPAGFMLDAIGGGAGAIIEPAGGGPPITVFTGRLLVPVGGGLLYGDTVPVGGGGGIPTIVSKGVLPYTGGVAAMVLKRLTVDRLQNTELEIGCKS